MGRFHPPLFFLALVCAVGIKVGIHETTQLSEASLEVQVRYELPDGVMILEPVERVKIRLRAAREEAVSLTPFNVSVRVALTQSELGAVDITEDRMRVVAPGEVEVISIDPNRFTLEVETVERATVPVRATLTGEPAAGASHGSPEVRPDKAEIYGPRSRVRNVRELTAPVNLHGHALTFEERVNIVSPDPLVKIAQPTHVIVYVPMEIPGSAPLFGNPSLENEKP